MRRASNANVSPVPSCRCICFYYQAWRPRLLLISGRNGDPGDEVCQSINHVRSLAHKDPSTVTSTVAVNPTTYTTEVETDLFTTSETTTVSTETELFTTQTTVTASTQTNLVTVTAGVNAAQNKRAVLASSAFPAYASACSSFEKYVSACSRVGVLPSTVTAETPLTTVVVTQTSVSPLS